MLRPEKQKINKKRIYGFDIETANKNKELVMASIYGDDGVWTFDTKDELLTHLKSDRFRDTYIVATNLSFDFFGLFSVEDTQKFKLLMRDSNLLMARTHIYKNKLYSKAPTKHKHSLTFIDTGNYCYFSVKQQGEILKLPKLDKPKALGRHPKNKKEYEELKKYNQRDAEVTQKFTKYLFNSFEKLGATVKTTIAATSMSLFRNKYLDQKYFTAKEPELLEQMDAYYGGRTEAFKRGKIENMNYYDVNSLYPTVMLKEEYPDPRSLRITRQNKLDNVMTYEGISLVSIYCPQMQIPLLPVRTKDKLLFPTGNFKGWYTHIELRKAMSLGYEIKFIHKTHYYTKNCRPFKNYVTDLYNKRLKYKEENNPMETVTKLLLNSLYGKFGQRFKDRQNLVPIEQMTEKERNKYETLERIGGYFRVTQDCRIPQFCFPIWASHITAHARLLMYDLIKRNDPVYMDTDSLITRNELPTGNDLGQLKKEVLIDYGYIVRPKFYALTDKKKDYVKIKGVSLKFSMKGFEELLENPIVTYTKFAKLKESIRRGFCPNEIIDIIKHLTLEDSKRHWYKPFNPDELHESSPIELNKEEKINVEKEIDTKVMIHG